MVERQWTEEEVTTAQTMRFQGASVKAIAEELEINWHTVNRKLKLLQPQARARPRVQEVPPSARATSPQKKSLCATSNMVTLSLPTLLLTYLILSGRSIIVATNGRV